MYVPLLDHLVRVVTNDLRTPQVRKIMRDTGRSLAGDFLIPRRATLEERVRAANELMIAQLGSATHVERRNGGFVIRGASCPIAAISGKQPSACLVVEAFLQEIIAAPVHECCERGGRPRCCFEIKTR
jgi:predicted ArsR family transcriptional regulator